MRLDEIRTVATGTEKHPGRALVMPMLLNDGRPHVHVDAVDDDPEVDRAITLAMTPAQARELARALFDAAAVAENASTQ